MEVVGWGIGAPLRAPSAWLVPSYVAMCSNWPRAKTQRPFIVARVAGWGLPLIPGQVFISKGRGRATTTTKKDREKDKQKKQGGGRGGKSQPLQPIIGNTSRSFLCV